MTSSSNSHSNIASNEMRPNFVIKFWSLFWAAAWIVLIVLLVLRIFIFQQVNVVGASMEPNYYTDERLVVNRRNKMFVRGQVVAAYSDPTVAKNATPLTPYDPSTRFFLKRIIALPGESIEIIGSKVVIYNDQFPGGRILKEDYIAESVNQREDIIKEYYPKTEIPEDHYFLMGDNRANSQDSRTATTGPFPIYSLFGQESFRYWPLNKAEVFELPQYQYLQIDRAFEATRQEIIDANQTPSIKSSL